MKFPEYLEPVFLNDSMLYNSAAYLLEHLKQNEEVIEEIARKPVLVRNCVVMRLTLLYAKRIGLQPRRDDNECHAKQRVERSYQVFL